MEAELGDREDNRKFTGVVVDNVLMLLAILLAVWIFL
jgi:hypothetical protein